MRKIDANDFATMELLSRHYKGMANPVVDAVRKLEVGEGIVFEKAEWERKASPSTVLGLVGKKMDAQFTVRRTADDKSYAVLRKA